MGNDAELAAVGLGNMMQCLGHLYWQWISMDDHWRWILIHNYYNCNGFIMDHFLFLYSFFYFVYIVCTYIIVVIIVVINIELGQFDQIVVIVTNSD